MLKLVSSPLTIAGVVGLQLKYAAHMKRTRLILFTCLTMSGCAHSQSMPETDSPLPQHHLPDGTFRNNYLHSINKPFSDLLRWWWTQEVRETIRFPLAKNDPDFLQQNRTESTLTWIGHATLLIQFDGLNIGSLVIGVVFSFNKW